MAKSNSLYQDTNGGSGKGSNLYSARTNPINLSNTSTYFDPIYSNGTYDAFNVTRAHSTGGTTKKSDLEGKTPSNRWQEVFNRETNVGNDSNLPIVGGYSYTAGTNSGPSYDYYNMLMNMYNNQYNASMNAINELNKATERQNKQAFDDNYRQRYSAFQKNNKMLVKQIARPLSGNALTQKLANRLNFANGVYNDMNNYNNNESQRLINNYTNQANAIGNYANSINGTLVNSNLNADQYRRLISQIKY